MDKLFSMDLREHVVDAVVKSELSCHHAAVPTDPQCDAGQDRRHKPKAIAGEQQAWLLQRNQDWRLCLTLAGRRARRPRGDAASLTVQFHPTDRRRRAHRKALDRCTPRAATRHRRNHPCPKIARTGPSYSPLRIRRATDPQSNPSNNPISITNRFVVTRKCSGKLDRPQNERMEFPLRHRDIADATRPDLRPIMSAEFSWSSNAQTLSRPMIAH